MGDLFLLYLCTQLRIYYLDISFILFSFATMTKEEAKEKVSDLTKLIKYLNDEITYYCGKNQSIVYNNRINHLIKRLDKANIKRNQLKIKYWL